MRSLLILASAILVLAAPLNAAKKAECCDCCTTGVCECDKCTCCDCSKCPSCE